MAFDPKVSLDISSPLMGPISVPAQNSASSLCGRTVVHLPADDKYRKGWEILGVTWIESLDEKSFLAQALLPEGWKAERLSTLYSDHNDITIIDSTGQEQVKMWIQSAFYDQRANVSFLKIDEKLLTEKKESEAIKDDFQPVCYPGYYGKFYCSYDEIVGAIESWGKVEAIVASDNGINHTFIVSFKNPIRLSSYGKGIKVNLTGGHGIIHTPFFLRTMSGKGSSCSNVILSDHMMAFDIRYLHTGSFYASALWESQGVLIDERLSQIKEEVGEHANWKKKERRIDSTFSESDKAKKLLEWIKQSGLSILEKGLYKIGRDPIGQYPVDEIVENYTSLNRSSPWQVVMRAEK